MSRRGTASTLLLTLRVISREGSETCEKDISIFGFVFVRVGFDTDPGGGYDGLCTFQDVNRGIPGSNELPD